MRTLILTALAAVAVVAAPPGQAQGGEFMWCQAMAVNGGETTTYYSAFFAAPAWQADTKAKAFKAKVADEAGATAAITATCKTPAGHDAAVAARNAAMKAAPGKVLNWEG